MLKVLPCLDSEEMAMDRKKELRISRARAIELGRSAVQYSKQGFYITDNGNRVNIKDYVQNACKSKISIPPDADLPEGNGLYFEETIVQVSNETTLGAAKRLVEDGKKPLALNFANGINPGGGFLHGARAQEETICRSSALYLTLVGDPMYEFHKKRPLPDSTDWAIYSPDVPVFRDDDGELLDKPWLLSFITCAAPYAPTVGQPLSRELLKKRIYRILSIAKAYGYKTLVLGAWGCGAFGNDPYFTAKDFKTELETEFDGFFSHVVFAISDWSPERRTLGIFCEVFSQK